MIFKLRYVTKRVKAKGRLLWYWQRPGFPLTRLPDTEAARIAKAATLNERADIAKGTAKIAADEGFGTMAWLVGRYRASETFTGKTKNTQTTYEAWMRRYESGAWGPRAVMDVDFRMVDDWSKKLGAEMPGSRKIAVCVLANLFKLAKYERLITDLPTDGVGTGTQVIRDQRWFVEQIEALFAAASRMKHGATLILGIKLLLHTAQRPGDVLAMTWARWSDDGIEIRQQKTGAFLRVWCHTELRSALTEAEKTAKGLTILAGDRGAPVPDCTFRSWFYGACEAAGIEGLQLRDFRRTAVVRMAEAGCTIPEISSVSGHSITKTQQILETYMPRTPEMAKNAIEKMEALDRRRAADRADLRV